MIKILIWRSEVQRDLGDGHDRSKKEILKDRNGEELRFPNRKAAKNYLRNHGGGWPKVELLEEEV